MVDRENLGHDVEGVQAERIGGRCLAEHSLEDGEGSLWEFVHVDACGYTVMQRAGLDNDSVVAQAGNELVEVHGGLWRFLVLWRLVVRCADSAHGVDDCRA